MIILTKLVVKDNYLMMNLVIMKKNLVQILIMEVKM